jgi:diadenosine tetraphosphate (Ap4A) HIT family hydrolase
MKLVEAQQAGIAPWDNLVEEKFSTRVYFDKYPCTPGHRLYVPITDHPNHIARAMEDALADGIHMVAQGECDAFNIGYNGGEAAGQTVMYPHVHLIPRHKGDVADPVGGVRNTIPGKGNYRKCVS